MIEISVVLMILTIIRIIRVTIITTIRPRTNTSTRRIMVIFGKNDFDKILRIYF